MRLDLGLQIGEGVERLAGAKGRQDHGAARGLATARLVDQGGHGRGELGGVEALEHPSVERLHDDQVGFVVDAPEGLALVGEGEPVDVAEPCEHRQDPVEGADQGAGPLPDLGLERDGVALELVPALHPALVLGAVGTAVHDVVAELCA